MTLNEFKYWLEGYSESFKDGVPSKEQWEKIKGQLDSIFVPGSFQTLPNIPSYPKRPFDNLPPETIGPGKVWYTV